MNEHLELINEREKNCVNIFIDIMEILLLIYSFIIWINGNKALGNWYHYALNMMIHPNFSDQLMTLLDLVEDAYLYFLPFQKNYNYQQQIKLFFIIRS